MEHTFLFEEAVWEARGHYRNASGQEFGLQGETRVEHQATRWINEGVLRVFGEPVQTVTNRYEIVPFRPGLDSTAWISINPSLGRLEGRFVVVAETILSQFHQAGGRHHGTECLVQLDSGRYLNRGVLLQGGRTVSTWAVELVRR